ncbi:folate family ECF transporter S component [Natronospora cellulosivora (SeqCode)]
MKLSVRKLVHLSFLIALSIVLTRMLSIRIPFGGVEGVRIGFGALPIIFAGVVFGPLAGGIVGAISDLIGYFINPMGAYMPHFTLTSFLTGFIPGLIIFYVFKHKKTYWKLFFAIAIGQVISSIILVPYFMLTLFSVPLSVSLIPRIVSQSINIPLYAAFIVTLLKFDILNYDVSKLNSTI